MSQSNIEGNDAYGDADYFLDRLLEDIAEAARAWYHQLLPGGLPADWIRDRLDNPLAVAAAALALDHRLHLDPEGNGTDWKGCKLCADTFKGATAPRLVDPFDAAEKALAHVANHDLPAAIRALAHGLAAVGRRMAG